MRVAHDLPADAQNHRTVAADQGCKCDLRQLVTLGNESRQQLPVAHTPNGSRVLNDWKSVQNSLRLRVDHDDSSEMSLTHP